MRTDGLRVIVASHVAARGDAAGRHGRHSGAAREGTDERHGARRGCWTLQGDTRRFCSEFARFK